jgi:hypothetical protein
MSFLLFFSRSLALLFFLLSEIIGGSAQAKADSSLMNPTGLQQAVALDLVGKLGNGADGLAGRLLPREAEVLLFAPSDHVFDGMLNFAAHQEDGVATFEIHEAYIASSRLIPRSRIRVGQYFLGFGRLNQFHRHDWPFISAPRVQRDFFYEEGLLDSGAELSVILPLPFYFELTTGISNGWTFGHAHNEGIAPQIPTHYIRGATYASLPGDGGAQIGVNYLGHKDNQATQSTYWGLDFTAKWREVQTVRFLLQSETWLRTQSPLGNPSEKTLGLYIFAQYGFDSNVSLGVRFDHWSNLSLQDALGRPISNYDTAIVPTMTYKISEFTTLRAAYTYEKPSQKAFQIQTMFILGAHPAHEF